MCVLFATRPKPSSRAESAQRGISLLFVGPASRGGPFLDLYFRGATLAVSSRHRQQCPIVCTAPLRFESLARHPQHFSLRGIVHIHVAALCIHSHNYHVVQRSMRPARFQRYNEGPSFAKMPSEFFPISAKCERSVASLLKILFHRTRRNSALRPGVQRLLNLPRVRRPAPRAPSLFFLPVHHHHGDRRRPASILRLRHEWHIDPRLARHPSQRIPCTRDGEHHHRKHHRSQQPSSQPANFPRLRHAFILRLILACFFVGAALRRPPVC